MSNTKNRRVILYMAISVDGFIAELNDETGRVSKESWLSYIEFVKKCDVIIVGRKTAALMPHDEFIEGPKYLIASSSNSVDTGDRENITINSINDLPDVATIGIIGGGNLNGSIADLGLIDEINLDIEPIILGSGIRLFGDHTPKLNLKLQSSKKIGSGTIQNHYIVL